MGVVYRAQHAMLRRPTAIKLLNEAHQKEAYLTRFEREVQLMAELTHPNTVTVHDYGRTADGVFYYAMEYLDGVDLELLVSACGAQDPARVIHILRQVCGALGEAHGRGLIHRDVKPANVFLCRARGEHDVVKVLDFGLVKEVLPDADPTNTGEQSFLGTPVYMSPESISSSRELDGRSDLYSLGAVGYFLLCGERVFDGASTVQICAQHLYTAPVPPSERTDHPVPKDLEALLLACLAKKPEERPASAAALSAALAACADAGKWDDTRARTWWTERGPAIAARRASRKGEATVAHQQTIAVER
jgi:serine/threonine-protein kinase